MTPNTPLSHNTRTTGERTTKEVMPQAITKNEAEAIISKLHQKHCQEQGRAQDACRGKAAKGGTKKETRINKLTKATTKKKTAPTNTPRENSPQPIAKRAVPEETNNPLTAVVQRHCPNKAMGSSWRSPHSNKDYGSQDYGGNLTKDNQEDAYIKRICDKIIASKPDLEITE